ncbi:uncharacterized protein LOC135816194 [Sycon ciliatum]|uniref:uncharacterized protein LOC135816194 n=1 Tax=Sycon ciliatum TaxID=27933 RepID=UPI0031F71B06
MSTSTHMSSKQITSQGDGHLSDDSCQTAQQDQGGGSSVLSHLSSSSSSSNSMLSSAGLSAATISDSTHGAGCAELSAADSPRRGATNVATATTDPHSAPTKLLVDPMGQNAAARHTTHASVIHTEKKSNVAGLESDSDPSFAAQQQFLSSGTLSSLTDSEDTLQLDIACPSQRHTHAAAKTSRAESVNHATTATSTAPSTRRPSKAALVAGRCGTRSATGMPQKPSRKPGTFQPVKPRSSSSATGRQGRQQGVSGSQPTPESVAVATEDLSAWDTWLLKKAKQERDCTAAQLQHERVAQQRVETERQAMSRQHEKAETAWQEWCSSKARQDQAKQERDEQLHLEALRRKDKNKRQTELRAEQAFRAWLEDKQRESTVQVIHEQQKLREKEVVTAEKQLRATQAYRAWCAEADHRLSRERRREMFDVLRAPMSPTYCNPVPWQPVVVDKKKPRRRK